MFVMTIKGARRLGGKGAFSLEREEGAFVVDVLARRNFVDRMNGRRD